MNSNNQNDFKEQLHFKEASGRVKNLKDFYLRLGVYCTVNAMLLTVWVIDPYMAENFWKPTLSFTVVVAGLFILSNAIILFGGKYVLPKKWEQRKIKEFIDEEKKITKYE